MPDPPFFFPDDYPPAEHAERRATVGRDPTFRFDWVCDEAIDLIRKWLPPADAPASHTAEAHLRLLKDRLTVRAPSAPRCDVGEQLSVVLDTIARTGGRPGDQPPSYSHPLWEQHLRRGCHVIPRVHDGLLLGILLLLFGGSARRHQTPWAVEVGDGLRLTVEATFQSVPEGTVEFTQDWPDHGIAVTTRGASTELRLYTPPTP
jgi:hypothetical protein